MKKVPELDEELKDKETENLQDIDNAGEAGKEDELLSDAEIKRIADMNLDDIIEDATSDSVSVEDLFGNGDSAAEASQENADEPVQAASQPEEKADKASAEQAEAVQKQPDTTAAEAEQTETAGTQTENQNRRNKRKHRHRLNREKNRKLPDQRINLIKRKKKRRQRKPKRIKKDSLAQLGIFSLKVLRKSRKKRQAMSFFQERKCRKIQKMRMSAF